ncbi:MAG: 3'(2'),5'-bisphosphate nucleotidase CysQ [Nitrosomonadales bacterium]|nr:3'(2'),5'-bisphosphate nucleotidase CysQ [Nitrosomonadales bacterium]
MELGAGAHPWLPQLATLAQQAGAAILHHYHDVAAAKLDDKADGSPLTAADLAAHEVIVAGLQRIAPGMPIISEENKHNPPVAPGVDFWMVDPLDGTKEFIGRNGEFTVNIALMRDGLPVLSAVYAPVLGTTYLGQRGLGAWRIKDGAVPQTISVTTAPQGELRVVASRSHSDEKTVALLQKLPPNRVVSAGSSLKFCMVAEGSADFYPRLGTTMEWDTAAAQCVLEAAGGRVVRCDGTQLRYNKDEWRNPYFYAIGAWLPIYDEITATYRAA